MPLKSLSFSERFQDLFDFDKRVFFLMLVFLFLAIRFITNDLILQSIPGYEQLEEENSLMIFHIFNTLDYLWTPFALLWKFTLTTFVIWMGTFAFGYKVKFRTIWQWVMLSEVIFIFPELIKMFYFILSTQAADFQEIKDYYPLSLLSMFDSGELDSRYRYPLRALNLFEGLYIFALSFFFHIHSKKTLMSSFKVILGSYGLFFVLWLIFYVMVYR